MVKRYDITRYEKDGVILSNGIDEWPNTGRYVLYSDYQDLQKALEESLDGWQADLAIYCVDNKVFEHRNKKPSQLRSQFLERKE